MHCWWPSTASNPRSQATDRPLGARDNRPPGRTLPQGWPSQCIRCGLYSYHTHTHTRAHTHSRPTSSVTLLPTIDVHDDAYLRGSREVCLIPDRQARPPAAVCCMAPRCGLHALQFWLVPILHVRSTAQETCIVIDHENKNSRDMPVRIGPSQTFDLAAAASGKQGRSRHLLTTVQINEVGDVSGACPCRPRPEAIWIVAHDRACDLTSPGPDPHRPSVPSLTKARKRWEPD